MGIEEVERIKKFFTENELHPGYMTHKAVITSKDAAKTRGFELKQGIKALLFTDGNNNWVIVDVPADRKVDIRKLATETGWKRSSIRMASAEEVLEKTGCEIGAVPPFGHKDIILILVDEKIYENKISTFNIGLRTESVKIDTEEMIAVFNKIKAIDGNFVKD